jgi:crotonobetainyl-CoA:carnitine CoA-transferase CaiB-like acyl-CoA transferase
MTAPLAHLRVLELGDGLAAAYCGKLLATYGARVIKLEKPSVGDRTRSLGPFLRAEDPETSVPFLWLHMGKESVVSDLQTEAGRDVARQIALQSDVVIESFAPGELDGTSLSYNALAADHPRLVMTSITPFGQTGPYSRYTPDEIVSYATGGGMYLTGDPGREPLAGGVPVASYTAGMAAYVATLSAVYAAAAGGRGDHVDVSVQEAMLDVVEIAVMEHLYTGRIPKRTGDRHYLTPWGLFPCRDGWAAVIGGPIRKWLGGIDMFEEPRLADEKFRHIADRVAHRQEFEALLQPWLDEHDRREILAAARARGLAFGVLNEPEEVLASDQHRARDFFTSVDHPVAGEQRVPGEPYRFDDVRMEARRAPLLGEHTATVLLNDLGMPAPRLEELVKHGVVAVHGSVT